MTLLELQGAGYWRRGGRRAGVQGRSARDQSRSSPSLPAGPPALPRPAPAAGTVCGGHVHVKKTGDDVEGKRGCLGEQSIE